MTVSSLPTHFVVVGLSLSVLLMSCSPAGDEKRKDREKTQPLTHQQARMALLTRFNLGPSYRQVAVGDGDADDPGCFASLERSPAVTTELERDFDRVGKRGVATVVSGVMSYSSTAAMTREFGRVRRVLRTCTRLNDTSDGVTTRLDVSTGFEKSSPIANEQINIAATGTFAAGGQKRPGGLWMSMARIGNHATSVGILAVDSTQGTDLAAYTRVAINRLAAVAAGERPPVERVPVPTRRVVVDAAQRLHLQPYFARLDVEEIQHHPCRLLARQAVRLSKNDKIRPLRIRDTHLLVDHRATVIPPQGREGALIHSCGGDATWSDHVRDQVVIRLTLDAKGQAFVDIQEPTQ